MPPDNSDGNLPGCRELGVSGFSSEYISREKALLRCTEGRSRCLIHFIFSLKSTAQVRAEGHSHLGTTEVTAQNELEKKCW